MGKLTRDEAEKQKKCIGFVETFWARTSDRFGQGRKLKNKAKELKKELETSEVAKLTRGEVKKQKKRIGFVETFWERTSD